MEKFLFYGWWLLIDGVVYYLALEFLMDVTGTPKKNSYRFWWLVGNSILIMTAVSRRISGIFLLDILFLIVFARMVLRIRWDDLAAPAAILFTFYTFMEGFSAMFMSWISKNMDSAVRGGILQMTISVCLDGIYGLGLYFIRKRYLFTLRQPVSSYLYILLLPCILFVLFIRYGLRLDSFGFEEHLSGFGIDAGVFIFFMMLGAVVLLFLMIENFCRIVAMTEYEKTSIALKSQMESQRIYIEEARKRNEKYASFHHDMDNHLLVLSGLLREKRYEEAKEYGEKLYKSSRTLTMPISTGNGAVDILLKEKTDYAKRNGIEAVCNVKLPEECCVDDMDLCIIFGNLMDNAIRACVEGDHEKPFISISTRIRSRFLVIEAVNSSDSDGNVIMGTGLRNVKAIAEKYDGTMEIESGREFRVSVLLCLPPIVIS